MKPKQLLLLNSGTWGQSICHSKRCSMLDAAPYPLNFQTNEPYYPQQKRTY